ncbi:MAG: DUF4139 domain-containing protein [Gemmatimonadota bacterium]
MSGERVTGHECRLEAARLRKARVALRVRPLCGLLGTLLIAGPGASLGAQQAPTGLTIYNDGRVLVRRTFPVAVPKGASRHVVALGDADPATVFPLDPAVTLLRMSFDGGTDELSILRRAVGRTVNFRVTSNAGTTVVPGTVLGVDPERYRLASGWVTFTRPGALELPDSLVVADPVATLELTASSARPGLALGWLTGGGSWQATYQAVLGKGTARVTGAAVVSSGRLRVDGAEVQLLAGAVSQAVPTAKAMMGRADRGIQTAEMVAGPAVEEGVGEFHLYTLPGRLSLMPGTATSVALFDPASVAYERTYTVRGSLPVFGALGQTPADEDVPVEVTYILERPRTTPFGDRPIPAGVVRLFEADDAGRLQLVGESRVRHSAAGEDLRVVAGHAFDLVAKRTQTDYRLLRDSLASRRYRTVAEAAYRVVLRNASDSAVTVDVLEERAGDWSVLSSSVPAEKLSSAVTRFRVSVPRRGEATLTYRVRVVW